MCSKRLGGQSANSGEALAEAQLQAMGGAKVLQTTRCILSDVRRYYDAR